MTCGGCRGLRGPGSAGMSAPPIRAVLALALLAQAVPALAAGSGAPRNYFVEFYVVHILGLMVALTMASELAEKRGVPALRLRLWWNWFLLLSFALCAFSGLALFLPLQKPLAKLLFKAHVWTGAACCWAGLYHAAQRARSMAVRG